MTLLYCVNSYKGDEKIKSFIWDLITPPEHGQKIGKNHAGLAGAVPRGRKGKKARKASEASNGMAPVGCTWVSDEKYDIGMYLNENYRKHLDRHNNKILLRIRMLYYVHHEILEENIDQINTAGIPFR